jgi:hypothetical protein
MSGDGSGNVHKNTFVIFVWAHSANIVHGYMQHLLPRHPQVHDYATFIKRLQNPKQNATQKRSPQGDRTRSVENKMLSKAKRAHKVSPKIMI